MSAINESEKKRLQSLKERKQNFKTKEQLIRQALNNLDSNTTNSNKIVFDDDFGKEQTPKPEKKRKRNLFDDGDDDEDSQWNETEFSIEKSKAKKIILGNDVRFTLDNRFAEDNQQAKETEDATDANQRDLQKEKEKQLDILGSILGTPFTVKNQEMKTSKAKKGLMIRYDPTENGHCEYEVEPIPVPETKEKKTKKKKSVQEIEEPIVEVSKDIYYNVSDNLLKNFKEEEGFSLLKTLGREKKDTDEEECDVSALEHNKDQKFRFNFSTKNAFKYDSSDNEDVDGTSEADKTIDEPKDDNQPKDTNKLFEYKDTLFFNSNDVRFNEAVKFFSTEVKIPSNEEFKNLRRQLKMIVRMKIRKNEKKRQPYGRQRKIKRS